VFSMTLEHVKARYKIMLP